MNKYNDLLIIPSLIVLGLISMLPAKTIEFKNAASVVEPTTTNQIPMPNIVAHSAFAVNLENGKILFEKNSKEQLPLASLTKIISSLVIEDYASMDDIVPISKRAIATMGDSLLKTGDRFEVKDLLTMAMIESSNDAVSALVEFVASKHNIAPESSEMWFTNLMMQKAASLGANNMIFYNPTGLDITKTKAGSYGSAEDLIHIVQKSYSSYIWRFSSDQKIISKDGNIHKLNPTNILEGDIPQLIGSKTGFTDIAGGNLLIIFEYPINNPIAIVVLGSTSNGRFEDMKILVDYIKNIINSK